MKNVINNFGRNAGKIWTTINVHGPLNRSDLIKKTRLKENDFYAGVGWLARENKIYRMYKRHYQKFKELINGIKGENNKN